MIQQFLLAVATGTAIGISLTAARVFADWSRVRVSEWIYYLRLRLSRR